MMTEKPIAVLIPARDPGEELVGLVRSLDAHRFGAVIVVNDGSSDECLPVFEKLRSFDSVQVLTHAVNLGKGRALKTGLNYILTELPDVAGVVTADADGQHTPEDIVRVAEQLSRSARPILGARSFDHDVPWRSRFGNTLTRNVCWFLLGHKISDTQSGLRGFPRERIAEMLALQGERYEYEMNVLAHLCRAGTPPEEVPIATVYIEKNRSSHFDPIRDSMRIYFVLVRFYASSLIAAGIDLVGFSAAFAITRNVLFSFLFGRLSSLVNFWLNRTYVFRSDVSVSSALGRYYLLVILIGFLAYGGIREAAGVLHWNVYVAKFAVESLLSLLSFSVQQTFIFGRKREV